MGYIPDKSDEMRVGLLTELFWGRQVDYLSRCLKFLISRLVSLVPKISMSRETLVMCVIAKADLYMYDAEVDIILPLP